LSGERGAASGARHYIGVTFLWSPTIGKCTVTDLDQLNKVLRPTSPPRVIEDVYTDDQYDRILGVIERHGPWPTITAHHF